MIRATVELIRDAVVMAFFAFVVLFAAAAFISYQNGIIQ